jgi:hypothetical protein
MEDRTDALARVAHEIGGALAPARNALDLVRSERAGDLPPQSRRFVDVAARNLARATRILDNLVAIAAPGSYALQVEEVGLVEILTQTCDDYALEATARGIALGWQCDPGVTIPTDRGCLEQILANLVGNALKFTPQGGSVTLRLERPRGPVLPGRLSLLGGGFGIKPRLVCLEVQDTGVGLSAEAREHLFEPYFRATAHRTTGGTGLGLGLAVARGLARKMHGDVRLGACAGGQGARFVISLPADAATLHLVEALDGLCTDLQSQLAAAPLTVSVLRVPESCGEPVRAALVAALARAFPAVPVAVTALGAATWVVAAPAAVRPLLTAIVRTLFEHLSPADAAAVRMHAQQVRRGAVPDEAILQGLVRSRHPLPSRLAAAKEVPLAQDSARG